MSLAHDLIFLSFAKRPATHSIKETTYILFFSHQTLFCQILSQLNQKQPHHLFHHLFSLTPNPLTSYLIFSSFSSFLHLTKIHLTKIQYSHQFHKFQRGSPSIKNFITIKFG
ncbi:hypothetical protein RchiOBHm_Chr2g0166801 [Rosa chinensis]|uniref:Uncharacterized protein n=1 Tax=Rosa chinensis TaxID=74649 RepID=A0A2P6S454_ROSCH|nr:hypothetical protein RchiOBHm_Chr2g0166801 [Rosa chinensis]